MISIIVNLINSIIYVIEILIFIRCVLSFLPFNNGFTGWVYMATEPILSPFRRLTERFTAGMPVDFSPILALLVLQFLQRIITALIFIIF